ncbi:MAG: S-methyl-5-thioribose-1-phosphate isomerase [Prosthecobacter sp.]|jgi:methylthioribose-1-phosphate isomerase|uniref:S-methyl-5-thioribose-1-phosphate isomerase n=1 Tax=Prosthecobacter sp. TaxID=1965333 RepID=UPI0019FE9325|nr:S-methyl-5-thioribose-1-phosphate isomerase [Prosthecobacter sp.]MBE2284228.1 S-methyl-5-thioribose-1-phosphate isomerase [Prosthecobacter sp.]
MLAHGHHYRTVWMPEPGLVRIIDQRRLPWAFEIIDLKSVAEVAHAIRDMAVRGAGCIGATAGYGMALAAIEVQNDAELEALARSLIETRPTAVNLAWAVNRQLAALRNQPVAMWGSIAKREAEAVADEDAAACAQIGVHGLELIREIAAKKPGEVVNVLTHCNAGWLAFVDHGSATAPIYAAHDAGIKIHVWVDETRPRNQGARLTAWELAQHGVPHTVIADNTGGHLMQHGQVDLVITGADRVTRNGDVANKIGTYLKALAAQDNGVPFYVALPSSTFDWTITDGVKNIPIEQRGGEEVAWMEGTDASGALHNVRVVPAAAPLANFAFDVTPARLVTGLITERGVFPADEEALRAAFSDVSRASGPR